MQHAQSVSALNWRMLENVVQRAGHSSAELVDWSIHKRSGGRETVSDIYRVDVQMQRRDGSTHQLSLILKVIRATPERLSPSHWNYWRREAELYQSGVLSALPAGVSAPQCYGVVDQSDAVWLWLQYVPGLPNAIWSVDEMARVAFELGRFNAASLTQMALSANASIQPNWLRHYLEDYVPFIEQLPHLQTHPLVGRVVTPELLPRFLHLTAQREHLLNRLDNLPQVFCHMDAWRGNLFLTGKPAPEKQLVLIDWSFASVGAIGQELAPLIFTNRRTPDTYEPMCHSYVAGLNVAGWQGDERVIWQSSAIATALIYGVAQVGLFIRNLLDEREHMALVEGFATPIEQIPPRALAWIEFGLHHASLAG